MGLHVTERQLHLFKSKRQRDAETEITVSEFQLHCMVADTVRRWMLPGWISHIASGEKRDRGDRGQLKWASSANSPI